MDALFEWMKTNKEFAGWISAAGTMLAAFTALIIAIWGDSLRKIFYRPKIFISYGKCTPWIRHTYSTLPPIGKVAVTNFLLKVNNRGSQPARNVVARIESIQFIKPAGPPQIYHPSILHWSGTRVPGMYDLGDEGYLGIDIHPKSYHYLDFVRVFSPHEDYAQWRIWTDPRTGKGIPLGYNYEGNFHLNFYIASDTTKAKRYIAKAFWQKGMETLKITIFQKTRFGERKINEMECHHDLY